jgi:FtsP/CotA-like multicopper oxidase with cupredoxin domain
VSVFFLYRHFRLLQTELCIQTDVAESPIDVLSITVAQRYSVLVTARNDTSSNWAIHANLDTTMFDKVPPTLKYSAFDYPRNKNKNRF